MFFVTVAWGKTKAYADEEIVSNYPLQLIRFIYGKNNEGINDTAEKGGTIVSCAQNSEGYLYVLYTGNRHEVQVFDSKGRFKSRFGKRGDNIGEFSSYTCGISINSKNEVFIADVFRKKTLVFNKEGSYLREFSSVQGLSPDDPKQDTLPAHIAIGPDDNLYISDGRNGHVWIYSVTGRFIKYLGGDEPGLFPSAAHLCFDSKNRIYILEGLANCIQICTPEGNPVTVIGKPGSMAGQFLRISGIAVDSEDRVFATDILQGVIQIFDQKGELVGVTKEIITQEGRQKLRAPSAIIIGQNDLIYVVEQPLHRILVLSEPKGAPHLQEDNTVSRRKRPSGAK